jgi:hypothetical protein
MVPQNFPEANVLWSADRAESKSRDDPTEKLRTERLMRKVFNEAVSATKARDAADGRCSTSVLNLWR